MHLIYVISVWVHIIAACVWVGGMVFLVAIMVPSLRTLEMGRESLDILRETGRRFRMVGWSCFGLLFLTGMVNLWARGLLGPALADPAFWAGAWGQVFAIKMFLVLLSVCLSAVHDFIIGRQAVRVWSRDATSGRTRMLRNFARWSGRLNLVLALIIVLLGVMLVRGRPW